MSDQPPVSIQRPEPPRYTRELSDNDLANRETISKLRGLAGRYRAAIRDALDQLPDGTPARSILERALEDRP